MRDLETIQVVRARVQEGVAAIEALLDAGMVERIAELASAIAGCLRRGGKVILFGNGGSAAEAQHLAGELVGRFYLDRPALAAIALADSAAVVTAIANDDAFANVFSRQLEGLGAPGDLAIGLTTSGRSANVRHGLEHARHAGLTTVALTGANGAALGEITDLCLCVPSTDTPRVQECHLLIGHIACEIVEREMFGPDAGERRAHEAP